MDCATTGRNRTKGKPKIFYSLAARFSNSSLRRAHSAATPYDTSRPDLWPALVAGARADGAWAAATGFD